MGQVHFLSGQLTDIFADGPLDVHRRKGKAFVSPLGGDAKGVKRTLTDFLADSLHKLIEIRVGKVQRDTMGEGKVSDAEDPGQPLTYGLIGDLTREHNPDAAAQAL